MPFLGDIGHLGSVNASARRQVTLLADTTGQGVGALRITGMTTIVILVEKLSNAASAVTITPQVEDYPDSWYQVDSAQSLPLAVGSFLRFEFKTAANVVRLLCDTSNGGGTTDLDVKFQSMPF